MFLMPFWPPKASQNFTCASASTCMALPYVETSRGYPPLAGLLMMMNDNCSVDERYNSYVLFCYSV